MGPQPAGNTYRNVDREGKAGDSTSFYQSQTTLTYIRINSDNTFETRLIASYDGPAKIVTPSTVLIAGPGGKTYVIDDTRVVKVSVSFRLPIVVGSEYVIADTTKSKDVGPDYFSVRWEGTL